MEQRITVLEEKLMFLERHLGELDEVVRRMHATLDGLAGQMRAVEDVQRRQQWLAEQAEGAPAPDPAEGDEIAPPDG